MFAMEFIGEIELFAEYHPFIEVHLISLEKVLSKKTFGVVCTFAESLKSHFEVLIGEYFCLV
jgi:hypothetical protein